MPPHKVGLLWGALADLRLGVPTFVETESLPCMPHVCKHDSKQGVGGALVTARSGEPGAWRAECCVPGDTSKQQVGRAHRGRGAPLQSCGGGHCALASSGTPWAPHLPPPCQFLLQGPTWKTCTGGGRSLSNGAALDARGLGRARRQAGRPLFSPAGTHTSGPSAGGWPRKLPASCRTSAPAALCMARSPS